MLSVALVDDLMFLSRIREAAQPQGIEVRSVRKVSELVEACRGGAGLVLLDLDSARLPWAEALAALAADPDAAAVPSVGFVSHLHADRVRTAQAAGCGRVMARSAFVQELPRLLAGTREPLP
jgi:hypothetical protein